MKLGTFLIVVVLICRCSPLRAQSDEFLPEVNFYSKLHDGVRFHIQAKLTREANQPVQAEIGPSMDFYLHPLARLAEITKFDLDETKAHVSVFSMGYRYLPEANGGGATNRIEPVTTIRFPFVGKLLMSDRNRFDLDWKANGFTWRYRNRFQFERPLRIASIHVTPYASAEAFYQSEYGKWSDTAIYAGFLLPIKKRLQLDSYYDHQNETGKRPNTQLNQFGLVLNLYF
jgi:hypothetical protein